MNENKIIYRKEYVTNAIELLKQSEKELEETIEQINVSIDKIQTANEYPLIETMDKNLSDNNIVSLLKQVELETTENRELLETASTAMEEYNKEQEDYSYRNPETGGSPNPTIKNGPAIAALAGLAAVGASTLLSSEEDKEKTES